MKVDYYTLLGVAKDAEAADIRKAYRKLAMQFHPDRNQGSKVAEEKFKQISEAYAVLSDPAKRKTYDSFGSADAFAQSHSTDDIFKDFNIEDLLSVFGMKNDGWGNFKAGGRAGSTGGGAASGFSSVIDELFGRNRGAAGQAGAATAGSPPPRGRPQPAQGKGRDAEVPIEIGFLEALHGVERHLRLNIDKEDRELHVRIPAGVTTGKRLKVRGAGHKGITAPGDLHLLVTVQADARFERKGDDLHTVAHVKPSTLLLGGAVEVQAVDGIKTIQVGAATSSGAIVRIRHQGAAVLGKSGERGDLYVKLEVAVAAPLTADQLLAATALRAAGL